LSGISCTVRWLITWPTEVVEDSITGASAVTAISSVTPLTPSCTLSTTVCATPRMTPLTTLGWKPVRRASSR
jgi:hypothetical protein